MQEYATLRAFVAVAHTGSVSKAAEQLHLTQPAVSLKFEAATATSGLNAVYPPPTRVNADCRWLRLATGR